MEMGNVETLNERIEKGSAEDQMVGEIKHQYEGIYHKAYALGYVAGKKFVKQPSAKIDGLLDIRSWVR